MQIKTNIKTLTKVWTLLKEIGLENVLGGSGKVEFNVIETIDALLEKNKLAELISIITSLSENEINGMDSDEVVQILVDFFTATKNAWKKLLPVQALKAMELSANKK